jgi:hypothetical protein
VLAENDRRADYGLKIAERAGSKKNGMKTEIPAAEAAGIRSSFKTPSGKTGRNRPSGCSDGQTLKPAILFKIK